MQRDKDSRYTVPQLQDALKIAEQFGDADSRLFETLVRLAELCRYEDDEEGCDGKYKPNIDRAVKMGSKVKPRDAHFAGLLMDLGEAADPKVAPSIYRDALDIREHLFGAEDQSVAETYAAMAATYQSSGDQTGARRTMQYALEIRQRAHKEHTAGYAALLEDSARIYMHANDSQAQTEFERSLALREGLWGASDPRFVEAMRRIAGETWFEKRRLFSEKLYRRIVDIQHKAHTEKSEQYYSALSDLANFLRYQDRLAESQNVFEQAYAVREKMGAKDILAARCLEDLAAIRMHRGNYADAIDAGESSVQIRAHLKKPEDRSTISVDALLAEAYLQAHQTGRSEAYFRALHNETRGDSHYNLEETAQKLSTIYQERGNYPEAATKLEVAVASMEAQNPSDPRLPQEEVKLANLYQLSGRPADANRMSMAAIRTMGRSLKTQGDPKRLRYLFIGLFIAFVGMPIGGTAVCGLLFAWFARRMDRDLALLYRPEPEPAAAAPSDVASESAFVGGFLGLSTVVENALEAPAVAVAEVAPAVAPEPEIAVDPQPQVTAETSEPPVSQVALHADGSDLFSLRVLNLLLSLLTLGIYSFWGKAKVRRYVCGQAEYLGDWFAFHGTGRELLLGWLRALPALAFIFLFPTVLPLFWQHRASPYLAQLCAALAFLILWPIARVGAYRYRLNRLSWRAIRFSYRGKAPRYLGASVAGWLLSLVTLGLYVPFLQIRLRKLLMNRTYFGDRVFQFPGRGADLLPAWIFALPLTLCSFGIGWAWWSALCHRYYWAHTKFAGGRFRCTATGGKLLWLWVGNFLVIVPTLGLGMSWATLRTLRFWTKHIQLVGEPELASIQQDARATSASAESFADFLGFDFGF